MAEKSLEWHRCRTCGEEYQGNYCPRCGQSAKIGRYSFKNALLLFFDVWGMGNRGMFRTLRDLVLRPGYMIRDYISGMQMAYFPPFKLLFLMTAFLLVIQSGVNLKGENYFESDKEQVVKEPADSIAKKQADMTYNDHCDKLTQELKTLAEKNQALCWLLITLVYTYDMFTIYNIIFSFFCIPDGIDDVIWLLPAIPLKQLSGFKWWRTILYLILSYISWFIVFVGMVAAIAAILYYV